MLIIRSRPLFSNPINYIYQSNSSPISSNNKSRAFPLRLMIFSTICKYISYPLLRFI